MTVKPDSKKLTPEAQLRAYIDKLDPKNQKLFRSVRAAVRKRFPTANELAYDYSHALVIGYAPADQGIDAIVAIRASCHRCVSVLQSGTSAARPEGASAGIGKAGSLHPGGGGQPVGTSRRGSADRRYD